MLTTLDGGGWHALRYSEGRAESTIDDESRSTIRMSADEGFTQPGTVRLGIAVTSHALRSISRRATKPCPSI